jgi:flavin-dependent dehydrogenase
VGRSANRCVPFTRYIGSWEAYIPTSYSDETGWAWYIPLHTGVVSVGVVLNETANKEKKAALRAKTGLVNGILDFYRDQLELAPNLRHLLRDATLSSPIRSASDFSYSASSYGGPGYRIAGDAAGTACVTCFRSNFHLSASVY